ncbi:MAG: TlpA family protein disulfide reductase [Desulfovibrio sp.]|nr:TlpA family protein disulfide reductase [Desulfovibrio sp.]
MKVSRYVQMLGAVLLSFFCILAFAAGRCHAAGDIASLDKEGFGALLKEQKGKVVMVNFFATWCPPCRQEIPELVMVHNHYKGKNFEIIGLSVDGKPSQKAVERFMRGKNVPYRVFMAGEDLVEHFKIGSIPHNIFYNRDGQIVISQAGSCDADDVKYVVDELLDDGQ